MTQHLQKLDGLHEARPSQPRETRTAAAPGDTPPATPTVSPNVSPVEEQARAAHWRGWLVAMFPEYITYDRVRQRVVHVDWTGWSDALGVAPNTPRGWYVDGRPPNDEHVWRLARHLGVYPQTILYHSGRITLAEMADTFRAQPLELLEDEEYENERAAITESILDARWRERELRHLHDSVEYTRRLKALLQVSHADWIALRDDLRSPAGAMWLRAEIDGPGAVEAVEASNAANGSYYLPDEFTGALGVNVAPPARRRRRAPRGAR